MAELKEIRLEMDRGLSSAAQQRLSAFLVRNRGDLELAAEAKCLLSESLELQGRHADAVETLQDYETGNSLTELRFETQIRIRVRLALAYNYTGDFPKAIALLNSALRRLNNGKNEETALGTVYLALSRIYRTINEYPIARDHARKALAHFRNTGDWRGLAESYFAVALVELFEGEYEPALEHLGQVLKLVGDRPAAYLLGMTYTNLAAVCIFARRVKEGIGHLEKAVSYYETTEHKTNAIAGYNNLGVHLMLLGDWKRAEREFEKALELAENLDARSAKLPMVLDSLSELKILRGELSEARNLLEKAVEIAREHQNQWYTWQSLRTLGKCFLAEKKPEEALKTAKKVLLIGEKIGDRQAVREARLLKSEAYLNLQRLEESGLNLKFLRNEISQTEIDLGSVGELQRLLGRLATEKGDFETARQHFGQSASIFEILGDRYRLALANYWLGFSFAPTNPEKARDFIRRAIRDFAAMGAGPDLKRAEETISRIPAKANFFQKNPALLVNSLISRLADSTISRELLLRELASVLFHETKAPNILILTSGPFGKPNPEIKYGFEDVENSGLLRQIEERFDPESAEDFARRSNLFIQRFQGPGEDSTFLIISPGASAIFPENLSLDPLLKIVEIGLKVCGTRDHSSGKPAEKELHKVSADSFLPGFIHSSPAMEKLVEEIKKIRSSNVTVLITGESGTGKELIAQSVHKLSARSDKTFLPFNCTTVPQDLADAHLFGYRKGAFTGAVSNSEGLIRSAAGGTLFLDEIGDLPLEIQPKLLRFLQEGEIQPLGESHPVKVDVRIIAATNADLEQQVAEGSFREDLYYRLNVIRLQVPPLRERRSEIPALIEHYVKVYSQKFQRRNIRFAPETIDLLTVGEWHGNIRQLCNEIQRIIARTENNTTVPPDDLSPEMRSVPEANPENFGKDFSNYVKLSIPDAVEELEKTLIVAALERTGYNVTRSARELGITRRGLQLKLGRYNLKRTKT